MKPTKKAAKAAAKAARRPRRRRRGRCPTRRREEGVEKIKGHNYFIATVTRPPKVYRGNPFQVEVGLAYGGSWPADKTIELFRFANRVPLLFQRGACGITEAIVRTDWRNYLLSQPKGSLPVGPMALLVHIASVWVPFTSESKEAVAHYPDIMKEIQLAAQECGRKLATFIRKRKAARLPGPAAQHLRALHRGGRDRDRQDHGPQAGPDQAGVPRGRAQGDGGGDEGGRGEGDGAGGRPSQVKRKGRAEAAENSGRGDLVGSGRRQLGLSQDIMAVGSRAASCASCSRRSTSSRATPEPSALRKVRTNGLMSFSPRQLLLHGLARRVLHDHELPDRAPDDLPTTPYPRIFSSSAFTRRMVAVVSNSCTPTPGAGWRRPARSGPCPPAAGLGQLVLR